MIITEVDYCPLSGSCIYSQLPRPPVLTPTHCLKCDRPKVASELGWVASPTTALGWMCWVCWRRMQGKLPKGHGLGFYNPPPAGGMPEKTQYIPKKQKARAHEPRVLEVPDHG